MRRGSPQADGEPGEAAGSGGDRAVDAALLRLTDDQRVADAVETRRREHSLRQQSAESGSFGGVLTDLAERGEPVVVSTVTGRQVRGTITSLGLDHLRLQTPSGERSLVPIVAVTAVRSTPDGQRTVGDRDLQGARMLSAVLVDLAVDRPGVVVHLWGDQVVAGTLWSAGQDLLAVRSTDGATAYVSMAAISDLRLP